MDIYQQKDKPLFPDLLWNEPSLQNLKPKVLIIGGNKQSLKGPIAGFDLLKDAANLTMILPDCWQESLKDHSDDIVFCPSSPSGSLSESGKQEILDLVKENDIVLLIGSLTRNSQTKRLIVDLIDNLSKPVVLAGDSWQLLDNGHQFSKKQIIILDNLDDITKFFRKFFPDLLDEYSNKGKNLNLLEIVKSFKIDKPPLLIKHNSLIISRFENKLCYTYSKPIISDKNNSKFYMASWSAFHIATNPHKIFESLTTVCWQLNKKVN